MTTMLIHETTKLEVMECCVCSVKFAVPETITANRRENSGYIHCPNGHSIGWGKSAADKLREELRETQRSLSATKCDVIREQAARESVERELRRHKLRTKNGVCPCCQRAFTNLRRHIATKHPNWSNAADVGRAGDGGKQQSQP